MYHAGRSTGGLQGFSAECGEHITDCANPKDLKIVRALSCPLSSKVKNKAFNSASLFTSALYRVNPRWLESGEGEMFDSDPANTAKLDEALSLFKTLRPEFQDYALEQIKKLSELQEKK